MYIYYFVIDIRHKQYAFLEIDAKIQLYFYKSAFSAINFHITFEMLIFVLTCVFQKFFVP